MGSGPSSLDDETAPALDTTSPPPRPAATGDDGRTGGDDAVGARIGEYVVVAPLGDGAFGTVVRAVHPVIGKEVAIKILRHRYSSDADIVGRFVAEARAVNRIGHRNLVDVFGFGRLDDGRHYHVMSYLRGASLRERLAEAPGGRLAPDQARPVLAAIAAALDAAHAAGVIHRDLKPANVFLTDEGEVKLLDFGVAKLLDDDVQRTATGAPIGTPAYMSPEQARGDAIDRRSDVYAFGVLCYQVLTGQLPFAAAGALGVALQHVHELPAPPSSHATGLPRAVDAAIGWMLAKSPDQRPATAGLAFDALATALGHPPTTGAVVPPARLVRRPRRHRRWLTAAALVALAALAAVVIVRTRAATPRPPMTLVVVVEPDSARPTVRLDGAVVGFVTEVARDGREHDLEISAPGYRPLRQRFRTQARNTYVVKVRLAEDAPRPAPPAPVVPSRFGERFERAAPSPASEGQLRPLLEALFREAPSTYRFQLTCRGDVCLVTVTQPETGGFDWVPRLEAEVLRERSDGYQMIAGRPVDDPVIGAALVFETYVVLRPSPVPVGSPPRRAPLDSRVLAPPE